MTNKLKNQWLEPSHERQNGRPKDAQPTRTKEGRKLVLLMVGRYFTHKPSIVVRSNSNRRYKISISCQHNVLFSNRG